ncbi:hypothetical protein JYU34_005260 [Plutella xylostella]|uniref:Uncharacterized protein n=1 Tax=Plutella xylostella TaxID=51655 RepID=A0ABQ7QW88_PLUXY|nr:hypothetical protein JYU34_005260 [Plutella xylostella]
MKIDENFGWTKHIDYVSNKLRILLCKFYQLSFKIPKDVLKCIYLALVDSIVSYALDCYGLSFKTHIDKIEALQIRFLKLLVDKKTQRKCQNDYSQLFKILKVLPVSLKHKYLLAMNNHGSTEHITQHQHGIGTRMVTQGKYEIPRVNNFYGGRTLTKQLPKLLNDLPTEIRDETNKARFSRLLKKHLLSKI